MSFLITMSLFVTFERNFGLELQSTFTRVYKYVWIVNIFNVVSCIPRSKRSFATNCAIVFDAVLYHIS